MRVNRRPVWQDLTRRRLSRRRLLAGAAALGVGAAGAALAACGGEEEAAAPTPKGSPTPIARPLEPARTRGSFLRAFGYESLPIDTLDPHQSQFGPTHNMHSCVFSKVLKYDSVYDGIIGTDLAVSMPEVADRITYVIKIHPGATFHDTPAIRENLKDIAPGLPGRELTAEDIKYSIERQVNPNSPKSALYYWASHWATIDKIEVVDTYTLRITTKRPMAPFLHFLADIAAFVIPKELVDQGDEMNDVKRMVGTGPFILDKFVSLQISRGVRNPTWFARDLLADQGLPDRPILDFYEQPWYIGDPTAMEVAFRSKQVDSLWLDDPDVIDRVAAETGNVVERTLSNGPVASRFLCNDSPAAKTPFKDLRLRKAIHLAVDRNLMAQQMLKGGGYPCGPIAQGIQKWALTPAELATKPGYRFGTQEREEDIAEAKSLWAAGGGDSIGKISVVAAGIPGYIPEFFPQFQSTLKDVLGLELEMDLDSTGYTKLVQGAAEKRTLLSLSFENGASDPDDYTYPFFHTTGVRNSFNLSDPELDRLLDAQREEFDFEARHRTVLEIQDYLLDKTLAMVCWISPINSEIYWTYIKNMWRAPWYGENFNRANMWIDQEDPNFQGKQA